MTFTQTILQWYDAHRRELPWRDISDPYRIWVSEIILQQTQVAQGYDYYLRFIRRFPTVDALAAATQDEVMGQWQGLGYYSRARNMHAAAKSIASAGHFPTTYAGVRALKGVGDYTAAAICSFAYNLPHAVVDGNVYRVLARYFGIDTPIDTTIGKRTFAALAQELIDPSHPGRYNQALMDFGALQCTPRVGTGCSECPLSASCRALAAGSVDTLPVKAKRTAITHRYFVYIYATTGDALLLHQRPAGDIWQGLYEPLLLEFDAAPTPQQVQHRLAEIGLTANALARLRSGVKHQLTHRLLHTDYYALSLPPNTKLSGYAAVPLEQLGDYPVPRLVEKLFELITSTGIERQSHSPQNL